MDEVPIFTFVQYNFMLIAFVLVVKVLLYFYLRLKKPTLKTFLYFSDSNVRGTKETKRRKQKMFQNLLSVILIFLLLLQIIVFLGGAFIRHRPVDL